MGPLYLGWLVVVRANGRVRVSQTKAPLPNLYPGVTCAAADERVELFNSDQLSLRHSEIARKGRQKAKLCVSKPKKDHLASITVLISRPKALDYIEAMRSLWKKKCAAVVATAWANGPAIRFAKFFSAKREIRQRPRNNSQAVAATASW